MANTGNIRLELSDYISKPENDLQALLDSQPSVDTLRQWILKYKAYTVQVASAIGQVDKQIEAWKEETTPEYLSQAKAEFRGLPNDRAGQRRIKDLLQVYKESVKKLERVERRIYHDVRANQSEGSMISKIISKGILGLFKKSSSSPETSSSTQNNPAISKGSTQDQRILDVSGSNVDASISEQATSILQQTPEAPAEDVEVNTHLPSESGAGQPSIPTDQTPTNQIPPTIEIQSANQQEEQEDPANQENVEVVNVKVVNGKVKDVIPSEEEDESTNQVVMNLVEHLGTMFAGQSEVQSESHQMNTEGDLTTLIPDVMNSGPTQVNRYEGVASVSKTTDKSPPIMKMVEADIHGGVASSAAPITTGETSKALTKSPEIRAYTTALASDHERSPLPDNQDREEEENTHTHNHPDPSTHEDHIRNLMAALEKAAANCKPNGSKRSPEVAVEIPELTLHPQLEQKCEEVRKLMADLERSEYRFDRLQSAFISLRHKLHAANKEIQVLKDPQLCRNQGQANLEQRLAVALHEKKIAFAQQKNIEKLLEEVINEKDDLVADRYNMKKEMCLLRQEKSDMQHQVLLCEQESKTRLERLTALQGEVQRLQGELEIVRQHEKKLVDHSSYLEGNIQAAMDCRCKLEQENQCLKLEFREMQKANYLLKQQLENCENRLAHNQEEQMRNAERWKESVIIAKKEYEQELRELQKANQMLKQKLQIGAEQQGNVQKWREIAETARQECLHVSETLTLVSQENIKWEKRYEKLKAELENTKAQIHPQHCYATKSTSPRARKEKPSQTTICTTSSIGTDANRHSIYTMSCCTSTDSLVPRQYDVAESQTNEINTETRSHHAAMCTSPEYKIQLGELASMNQGEEMQLCNLARELAALNDQTSICCKCREKGAALAKLSHSVIMFIQYSRSRQLGQQRVEKVDGEKIQQSEKDEPEVDMVMESASELTEMEDRVKNFISQRRGRKRVDECKKLRREVQGLQKLLELEERSSRVMASSSHIKPNLLELQKDVRRLLRENDWLRSHLNRSKAQNLDLRLELEQLKEQSNAQTSEILRRASVTLEKTSSLVLERQKSEVVRKVKSMGESIKKVKKKKRSTNIKKSEKEGEDGSGSGSSRGSSRSEEGSGGSEGHSGSGRNSDKGDNRNEEENKASPEPPAIEITETEVMDERDKTILKLIEQNEYLNEELQEMKEKYETYFDPDDTDETLAYKVENYDRLKLETKKAKSELNLAQRQLTMCQQTLDEYTRNGASRSTAYLVRVKEEEIERLKTHIADLERSINQNQDRDSNPALRRKSRVKPETNNSADNNSENNQNERFAIMVEDTKRLKQKIDKLTEEKNKLAETIQQKDIKLVELTNEIKQHRKSSLETPGDNDTKQKDYRKKLKEGESTLSKIHVEVEMLTRKTSSNTFEENKDELEAVGEKSRNAQLLKKLIIDCVNRKDCKEVEMMKLCDRLDELEIRNYDLEQQLNELEIIKAELIPRLKGDLETKTAESVQAQVDCEKVVSELQETQLKLRVINAEKQESEERYERQLRLLRHQKDDKMEASDVKQVKAEAVISKQDMEITKLRQQLNSALALSQEREGSITHWKLKCEDLSRQIEDLNKNHKDENNENERKISRLTDRLTEVKMKLSARSLSSEDEMKKISQNIKEIRERHLELIHITKARDVITDSDINKFYNEIGELCVGFQVAITDRDEELNSLRNAVEKLEKEKDAFADECSKVIQEKQVEIRRLLSDIDRMEIDVAKQHALAESELQNLRAEGKHQIELIEAEKTHDNVMKDKEMSKIRSDLDKANTQLAKLEKMNKDLRGKHKIVELDKSELVMLKESWQSETDKLTKELQQMKADKQYLEKMVDRLNKEMENRITNIRHNSNFALESKDEQIKNIYNNMEKVARERGEMSTRLNNMLKERDKKIEELSLRLRECEGQIGKSDSEFKGKLEKKTKEVTLLRNEIKKMGTEGVKLLEAREKEINEMRSYLKNILKVMETRAKAQGSSLELPADLANLKKELSTVPVTSSAKAARSMPNGVKTNRSMVKSTNSTQVRLGTTKKKQKPA